MPFLSGDCGGGAPPACSKRRVVDDPRGQDITHKVPLPGIFDRHARNVQGPLSSCYRYLVFMHVILPAISEIRTRARCPDCNVDLADHRNRKDMAASCQDCAGSSMKSMGGYAGLAMGMALATECLGEATPRGHEFVYLANMYQRYNLEQTGNIIQNS